MFENMVLRRIFRHKRDEVTGEWRKLHNGLYSSHNIVRVIKSIRIRWAVHVARNEETKGVYRVLWGNLRERQLVRPRCRWEDNIKMDLQEVGRGCGDWMELTQDRNRCWMLVSTVMNSQVP